MALIYEALRLYPIVCSCICVIGRWTNHLQAIAVPKVSTQDTVFTTTDHQGRSVDVPIPAGTPLNVNIVGLHHNRKQLLCRLARHILIAEIG